MCDTVTNNQVVQRDMSFTIMKAIAIIFVVVAHSGGPSWLVNAAYIFCVPVFFMCSGYFFNLQYLNNPTTYVWHRFRNLYCPFWAWSIVFLVLHNFFFYIGILSEDYGNAAGGVTHPYNWHDFMQNVWSVTFNMSGYDQFLSGAFWFFRTMFISSLVFYFLFVVLNRFSKWKQPVAIAASILGLAFLLTVWKIEGNLRISGLAQGGYRELVALIFMSLGFIYRQYQHYLRPQWLFAVVGFVILALFTWLSPSSMSYNANMEMFVSLIIPASAIFITLHYIGKCCAERDNILTKSLNYIGERTLYIFAFHLLAFKVVSILKVLIYDLPWSHVGGHPVVHDDAGSSYFFLLYIIAGVGLPLLVVALWKKMDKTYNLTWFNCIKYTFHGLWLLLLFIKKVVVAIAVALWRALCGFFNEMKDFIKASNPKDE